MWPFTRRTVAPKDLPGFVRVVSADAAASLLKPRVVYNSHRNWAGAGTISRALDGIAEDVKNEARRHCCIGKITMKG